MKPYYIAYIYQNDEYEEVSEAIIRAKNKKLAIKWLSKRLGGTIIIDDIYETTEDAML